MKSLAFLPLAFALMAPMSDAQRSVQVGLGGGYQGARGTIGVQASFGGSPHYRSSREASSYRSRRTPRPRYERYRRAPVPQRVYVPGRYEIVRQRVWVAGATHQQWTPAQYETRFDVFGNPCQVLVRAGYYHTIQDPGYWDYRDQRIWVAAHWQVR